MDTKHIEESLDNLNTSLNTSPIDIITQLQIAYSRQVYTEVHHLLQSDYHNVSTLRKEWITYLEMNAYRVRGTALDYTAIPYHEVTQLLSALAIYVSETAEPEAPITPAELLLPGLSLISMKPTEYPNLCAQLINPKEHFTFEEENLLIQLQTFQEHPKTQRLIEEIQKEIDELTLKDERIFHKLINEPSIDVKQTLEEQQLQIEQRIRQLNSRQEILWPQEINALKEKKKLAEFNQENYIKKGNWFLAKKSLLCILTTHILSSDEKSLIPISELIHETPCRAYDEAPIALDDNEKRRLENHCTMTQNYAFNKERYETLETDTSNLLGHLTRLRLKLKFNDAHSGIGTINAAGSGVYPAIVAFYDYYKTVSSTEKEKIPTKIKNEIDKLFMFASDAHKNASGETCIGTRREAIENAMQNQEELLSKIFCSSTDKKNLIKDALESLLHTRQQIQKTNNQPVTKETLNGDRMPINESLIKTFQLSIQIRSLSDLNQFMLLSEKEILNLAQAPSIQEQLTTIFNNPEEFAGFIRDTSNIKLRAYFNGTKNAHHLLPIKNVKSLRTLLFELSEEKTAELVQFFNISELIKSVGNLTFLLNVLSEKQRMLVRAAISNKLPELINSLKDFGCILIYLAEEEQIALFRTLIHKLPNLVNSWQELHLVFGFLTHSERLNLLKAINNKFITLFKSIKNIHDTLYGFNKDERLYLFQYIISQLPEIINSGYELRIGMMTLTEAERAIFFDVTVNNWSSLMTSAHEFCASLSYLSNKQRDILFELIKNRLPTIVKSGPDFTNTIKLLSKQQCAVLFDAIKNEPGDWIITCEEFHNALSALTVSHRKELCEKVGKRWIKLVLLEIKPRIVSEILKLLPKPQHDLLVNALELKKYIFSHRDSPTGCFCCFFKNNKGKIKNNASSKLYQFYTSSTSNNPPHFTKEERIALNKGTLGNIAKILLKNIGLTDIAENDMTESKTDHIKNRELNYSDLSF